MRILITGGTGLIGSKISHSLLAEGHSVAILSRSLDKGRQLGIETLVWQPKKELPPAQALEHTDVVVHLAGEPIATGRWTEEQKRRIRDSRVLSTRNLVAGLRRAEVGPKALICASAVGFYGDRGNEELTEQSSAGTGFLSEVCQEWEQEAKIAQELGIRVVLVRIGIVLAKEGGALPQMLPIFKLGLGGSLGDGQQWFPWIHIEDIVGIFQHAILQETLAGPINAVSPGIVTNARLTETLSATLHRPAILTVPGFALRFAVGEMANLLLASTRVIPQVAIFTGYEFKFPSLPKALSQLIQVKILQPR
jgi:uncharacterized protein